MQIHDLPKPSYFNRSIGDLDIGTYDNIEVAHNDTPIIEALNKFVNFRISALPIVDDENKLIDIYAKFDVIVSAAEKRGQAAQAAVRTLLVTESCCGEDV